MKNKVECVTDQTMYVLIKECQTVLPCVVCGLLTHLSIY